MLSLISKYINYRQTNQPIQALDLCADDIEFEDPQNRYICSKEAFFNYLCENQLESIWSVPVFSGVENTVFVKGKVSKFWMWWDVTAYFSIENNLIKKIVVVKD